VQTIKVTISGELELDVDDLPPNLFELIKSALTVKNEDREKKMQEKVFGSWDLPEFIPLYKVEHRRGGAHKLLLPRGFAANLASGIAADGHQVIWDDQRSSVLAELGYFKPFTLRDYQFKAATEMLKAEQGVYQSPAGSGKTVTALGVAAYAGQRTIWITDKAGLLEQTRARAMQFLQLEDDQVGKIGEGVWEERDFTVALRQTLWARLWEIDATTWFDKWGMVLLDEVHHASAETLSEVVRRARTRYLLGFSATPAKTETQGRIVHSIVGPIVAETHRQELYDRGVLMKPSVRAIYTGHDDVFWDTHDAVREKDGRWHCKTPDCRKHGQSHSHRNNYSSVLKNLVESPERAALIAAEIVRERGHVHLINSRQLKHLDILRKACVDAGWDGPIYMLRGEENAEGLSQPIANAIADGGFWELYDAKEKNPKSGRQIKVTRLRKVSDEAPHGREAIIFSTVADEGLDIPQIDRVHLPFPFRQEAAYVQVVGRGERISAGKEDSVIVDYRDRCQVFAEQAQARDGYARHIGYEVKEVGRS
jgi:superfamily II DNA or RNA helicase